MDYKKAYKEMVQRARELHESGNELTKKQMEIVCPELAESDDERIRKTLLEYYTRRRDEGQKESFVGVSADSVISWLEKQREMNYGEYIAYGEREYIRGRADAIAEMGAEWSEEDEVAFGELMWCIEQARKSAKDENDMGNIWFAENWLKNRLKSLRPQKQETLLQDAIHANDYDKKMLGFVMDAIRHAENYYIFEGTDYSSTDIKAWVLAHFSDQEWSEKDEHMKDTLEYEMRSSYFSPNLIHWTLSHLQPHWKPSNK